ncbi:MAG: heavy-metal-associated domain-containing protein [Alicyclobacillus herbarius]|uniref:heavy-metal-associated domain-containing protein n=1 Tax=Alicyclobacillus herbarius TaxID=122960 RepID=UPI00055253E7|nr:heavy metal-associated domain-containing protein [Alicyclobacillus herbarius]MCL6631102.1 heavy-metal-associated domain-containing protein [Alicyclobacillus herbarius]
MLQLRASASRSHNREEPGDDMDTVTIPVHGMRMQEVTRALKQIEGVRGVDIDLSENLAVVTYDEDLTDAATLRHAVQETIG